MNEVQNAVESEFYEDVFVEVAEIVVQGGNFTAEADANINQESVKSEFYEDVKYVAEDSNKNEDQEAAVSEFHEDMQVVGEECDGGNYTNEVQQFVSGGEAVAGNMLYNSFTSTNKLLQLKLGRKASCNASKQIQGTYHSA
jgi:hypothetical protein